MGVISQAEFTLICLGNDKNQRKKRHFLLLDLGEKKTIIFVGNCYKDYCNDFIYSTIDFSEQQYHANTFVYVQTTKNKQYLEALEAGNMDKAKEIYKEIGTIALAFL